MRACVRACVRVCVCVCVCARACVRACVCVEGQSFFPSIFITGDGVCAPCILFACQVRITVGDSALRCLSVHVTRRALLFLCSRDSKGYVHRFRVHVAPRAMSFCFRVHVALRAMPFQCSCGSKGFVVFRVHVALRALWFMCSCGSKDHAISVFVWL